MNTTQQDSAISVLYEVIIFFDFSFFFVYHKNYTKHQLVLLACVTLNFMDTSRPMGVINSGAHQVLDYVDLALDLALQTQKSARGEA